MYESLCMAERGSLLNKLAKWGMGLEGHMAVFYK